MDCGSIISASSYIVIQLGHDTAGIRERLCKVSNMPQRISDGHRMVVALLTLPPKIVALAMKVFPVMVFPILLYATPLPDGERPTSNYIPKSNLKVKVLDFVQLGGLMLAVAYIPPKSAPADYTRFFVSNAFSRYQTQGFEATLAHYSREESIRGQWYVFIIDENDRLITHPNPYRLGLDLKSWVGTDANGYNFGPDMLWATEDGKWGSYVYRSPESGGLGADHTGTLEYKHVWVVRHDGLLFVSGWYV